MSDTQAPDPAPPEEITAPQGAVLRSYPEIGWHLVQKGTWEVGVSPDGLLLLPRHLHPDEVADFIAAATAASQVGAVVIANNDKLTTPAPTPEELAAISGVFVAEGEPPPGAVRMVTTPRADAPRSAIGRVRGPDPRAPRMPAAPAHPVPAARRGRENPQEM